MKRDFDCDTCLWFENGRCINFDKPEICPCSQWIRNFDPEKEAAEKIAEIIKTEAKKAVKSDFVHFSYSICMQIQEIIIKEMAQIREKERKGKAHVNTSK